MTTTQQKDPLYDEAVKLVREKKYASVSAIQRGLRISYSRALRLMKEMEGDAVTPEDTYGHRDVIYT
jgi:S-DNA-T family DNA segregation ATPase FtsK/SpoIIIE